ncbi:hypothetical protein H6A33_04795 [Collinsella tanakaei]|nr:hypothetical protein [Collinsella tanakaei]
MSLISLYTTLFETNNVPYDIIYMDKYGVEERTGAANVFRYENVINAKAPKPIRALKYLKFIKYAVNIIDSRHYDFIVVWGEVAALLFGRYLSRHHSKHYCINIRDYLYQDKFYVRSIFRKTMAAASFTTISSKGYRTFLPNEGRIIEVHSLNETVLSACNVRKHQGAEPIKIGFIGYIRFFEINKKLIDVFANDSRFELHYYGSHSEFLEEYANSRGVKNCVFSGGFSVQDTGRYIDRIDIINNLYGSGSKQVDYALSIRLYYSLYCNIPILVNTNTYMEKVTKRLGVGFAVDQVSEGLPDELYEWYSSLDYSKIASNCKEAVADIRLAQVEFFDEVQRIANCVSND